MRPAPGLRRPRYDLPTGLLLIRFAQQDHYPWWFGSSPTTIGWAVLKDADKQESRRSVLETISRAAAHPSP